MFFGYRVARSAEVDYTGLAALDAWFSNRRETGEEFDLAECRTTLSGKRTFDGHVNLTRRKLPTYAVRLAIDRLLVTDEARARIFDQVVLRVRPLERSVVTCARMCSLHILTMMEIIGTFLMCPMILTSTLVAVFVDTSTPFANCAVAQMLRYQRAPVRSSVLLRRS